MMDVKTGFSTDDGHFFVLTSTIDVKGHLAFDRFRTTLEMPGSARVHYVITLWWNWRDNRWEPRWMKRFWSNGHPRDEQSEITPAIVSQAHYDALTGMIQMLNQPAVVGGRLRTSLRRLQRLLSVAFEDTYSCHPT